MSKYKVGDRVRVRSMERKFRARNDEDIESDREFFLRELEKYCGETHIISNSYSNGAYALKGIKWVFTEEMLEEEKEQSIHITRKGNEINAVLKENGKIVKRSKAICCEEDTFGFRYGSKLAVDRLFDDEKEKDGFKPCLRSNCSNKHITDIGTKTNMTLAFGEPLYTGDIVEKYCTVVEIVTGKEIVCGNNFVMGLKGVLFENGISPGRTCKIRKVQSYKDLKHNQVVGDVIVKLEE